MITVEINQETYVVEKLKVFEFIVEKLNQLSEENKLVFSHLIIDGQEVYTDHENYINQYINDIKVIGIEMISVEVMINNILSSLKQYLDRSIPTLESLVSEDYGEMNETFWGNMFDLSDGIQAIIQFTESLKTLNQNLFHIIEGEINKLSSIIPELLSALESKDVTLSFDILSFEILPIFESLQLKINELITCEKDDSIEQ